MCIVTFELNLHIGLDPIVDIWLCYVGRVVQAYKTLTKGYTIEFVLFWGFLRASRIVAKFSCLDGEVLRQDQLCTMILSCFSQFTKRREISNNLYTQNHEIWRRKWQRNYHLFLLPHKLQLGFPQTTEIVCLKAESDDWLKAIKTQVPSKQSYLYLII